MYTYCTWQSIVCATILMLTLSLRKHRLLKNVKKARQFFSHDDFQLNNIFPQYTQLFSYLYDQFGTINNNYDPTIIILNFPLCIKKNKNPLL